MKKILVIFASVMLSACQSSEVSPVSKTNIAVDSAKPHSAKCLAQLAVTESRSILAQSPTLTASIDEEGDSNVNLRLDAMEFYRAGLNRKLTLADCNHDAIIKMVRDISRLSARRIARNSLLSRARKLNSVASRFKKEIRTMIDDGHVDEARAERLFKAVRNITRVADRSIQQASGLQEINFAAIPDYKELEGALTQSLLAFQDHRAAMEVSRNIRVNLTGGVRYDSPDVNTIDEDETEEFGSIALSIRLGMFDPRLARQQQHLIDAEFDELYEDGTGLLWQLQDLHQNNLVSEKMLLKERQLILEGIASTRQGLKREVKPERILAAKISLALAEADVLRININLKELRIMLDKLSSSQLAADDSDKT